MIFASESGEEKFIPTQGNTAGLQAVSVTLDHQDFLNIHKLTVEEQLNFFYNLAHRIAPRRSRERD